MCLEVDLMLDKKLMMEYKQVFLILKKSFKIPLKIIYGVKGKREKSFWLHGDGLKELRTMNPMENHKKKNKTSENMTFLIDNKNILCQHNKFYPLTDRRGKWISEKIYRDIENIIQHDSQKYIPSDDEE